VKTIENFSHPNRVRRTLHAGPTRRMFFGVDRVEGLWSTKNRNLKSVFTKNELFVSPWLHLPALYTHFWTHTRVLHSTTILRNFHIFNMSRPATCAWNPVRTPPLPSCLASWPSLHRADPSWISDTYQLWQSDDVRWLDSTLVRVFSLSRHAN
jgi:hypothetical protein